MEMSEAKSPHGEQSVPYEWGVAKIGDDRYIVRDKPEGLAELYEVDRTSDNPREILRFDGVLYDGVIYEPVWDEEFRCVQLCHTMGGVMHRLDVEERLESPSYCLKRIHVATHILDFRETNKE